MIYIKINDKNEVIYQHYMPFDSEYGLNSSSVELEETGYLVDSIPEPDSTLSVGHISTLIFNPLTKKFKYEYAIAPPRELTKEEQLQNQVEMLILAMANMIGG